MWDRQYIVSFATTVAAGALAAGALAGLLVWLGWTAVVGLLAIVGGFLLWFYLGPRPDLRSNTRKPGGDETGHA